MYYVLTSMYFFGALKCWTGILLVHGLNTKDELMNTKVVKKCASNAKIDCKALIF